MIRPNEKDVGGEGVLEFYPSDPQSTSPARLSNGSLGIAQILKS